MSSSSGNTVGPIEALQLVPPEILRFLIANSKPSKAIEFDTGMGLVNLQTNTSVCALETLRLSWPTLTEPKKACSNRGCEGGAGTLRGGRGNGKCGDFGELPSSRSPGPSQAAR